MFDQWNAPIATKRRTRDRSRLRRMSIDRAHGRYFVRVYAPARGDDGQYMLLASFKPDSVDGPVDPRAISTPIPGSC